MHTKIAKSTRHKVLLLLLLRRLMCTKMPSLLFSHVHFMLFFLNIFYALFLFLLAYVLFMLFMFALRLSFLFSRVLFMLFMPHKRLFFSWTFLCTFKTAFIFYLLMYFLCFLCLWDFFLKGIKLPQYHHLLYYWDIITKYFYRHNTFLLSQYISIITIHFHHY